MTEHEHSGNDPPGAGAFHAVRSAAGVAGGGSPMRWRAIFIEVMFSLWPHSVQRSLAPTGYAHAGHRPRLIRRQRRNLNGAANSSHRIAA